VDGDDVTEAWLKEAARVEAGSVNRSVASDKSQKVEAIGLKPKMLFQLDSVPTLK
jgi:hypothetical protein